jgi:acetyl-CoA carboxylase biotin carboxyl carrier protein
MIDIRKLKELVRLMVDNDLTELDLRDSEEQVTMRRPDATGSPHIMHHSASAQMYHAPAASHAIGNNHGGGAAVAVAPQPATRAGAAGAVAANVEDEAGLQKIESPMVGTFYAAPNPDAKPFVGVGSNVSADTVVCIIEAMKIFNEIKAECSGTIEKMLVKSGQAVEFGQPLFLVRPV